MAARLEQLAEETLLESSPRDSGALRNLSEASGGSRESGFNEDLIRELEAKIASSSSAFNSENAQAIALANLPPSAGKGTSDIAGAKPWTGQESLEDAALRMLNDAHKPMRIPRASAAPKLGPTARIPSKIDTGRTPSSGRAAGVRIANALEKAGVYSTLKDESISKEEREKLRQELKDRFQPHARAVPGTIQGLASLANERIEDAIKRGQFKNLPRGQKIERDYNASSPFLDTTEYFMNKIIQKQEIVPPWIEKQQELVSTVGKFRSRLRADWKRHAARVISSKGGTLEEQVARAQRYAEAEERENPRKKKVEQVNVVDKEGHLSQITLSGELKVPSGEAALGREPLEEDITITERQLPAHPDIQESESVSPKNTTPAASEVFPLLDNPQHEQSTIPITKPRPVQPFRDPVWLQTEHSFLTLSITQLNSLTRTYNLQAPRIAQKPYYNLERELQSCYADVAPLLPLEIRQRAMAPKARLGSVGDNRDGSGVGREGLLEGFGGRKVNVRDERLEKRYGVREFWRDLWQSGT